jgi:phenylalanyl-tRNA synthetase beta subunit
MNRDLVLTLIGSIFLNQLQKMFIEAASLKYIDQVKLFDHFKQRYHKALKTTPA